MPRRKKECICHVMFLGMNLNCPRCNNGSGTLAPPVARPQRVYLAGPMTGIEDFNYPAFHAAAAELRAQGYEVLNPAEHFDGDQSLPYETYMRGAIQAVLEAEAIYTLPGWQKSRGARMEMLLAQRLGLPHINADGSALWNLEAAFTAPPMRVLQVVDGKVVDEQVVHG